VYTRRELTIKLAALGGALWASPPRMCDIPLPEEENGEIHGVPVAYRRISVDMLPRVKADMERILQRAGVSDNPTFRSYLENRRYEPPKTMPDARSVVIVAIADRRYELDVRIAGTMVAVPIPPGYTSDEVTPEDVLLFVRRHVLRNDTARLEPATLPLKLIAARTGLAEYGKNNITFVPGMGSFHRLRAFFTEQPCSRGTWHSVRPMHLCKGCSICTTNCPTQAIRPDRFVIDAGRCVTLYNELPEPMPAWMPARAHNALVGCTLCQWKCPANVRAVGRGEKLAELTEEETSMLLSGTIDETLGASVAAKLARNDLAGDLAHLARNLRLALHA
jgi:epoxyqueuosine reductase